MHVNLRNRLRYCTMFALECVSHYEPFQPLPELTEYWSHRDSHWIGLLRWTCCPVCLSPSALLKPQNGNPAHPSHSLAVDELYLGVGRLFHEYVSMYHQKTMTKGFFDDTLALGEYGTLTWNTGSKLMGKFWDQVIIYPVLHWTQDDHRPCVMNYKSRKKKQMWTSKVIFPIYRLDVHRLCFQNRILTLLSNHWLIG